MSEEDVFGLNFERWDPRREVFLSDSNTYVKQSENFLAHLPSINENRSKNTKIKIKNIPAALNQNGAKNLFSKAGKVKQIEFERTSVIGGVQNCTVEFASGTEAERAIRMFNNFKITNGPPLQIRIALTRRQIEERQKSRQREYDQIRKTRLLPGFDEFVEDISFFKDEEKSKTESRNEKVVSSTDNETFTTHPDADREIFTVDDDGGGGNLLRFETKNETERFMTEVYVEPKCVVCGKKCCFVCECQKCTYCSLKCQEIDWKIHYKFCAYKFRL